MSTDTDRIRTLNDELRRLTADITRTRMSLRDLDGPVPTFLGGAALRRAASDEASAERSELLIRLAALTRRRRDLGGPLPASAVDHG